MKINVIYICGALFIFLFSSESAGEMCGERTGSPVTQRSDDWCWAANMAFCAELFECYVLQCELVDDFRAMAGLPDGYCCIPPNCNFYAATIGELRQRMPQWGFTLACAGELVPPAAPDDLNQLICEGGWVFYVFLENPGVA